jgi:hypothetical protein
MDFASKCDILADAWTVFDNDEDWEALITYADLGLPFAFGVANGFILDLSPEGEAMIQDSWEHLCNLMDLPDDEEWESLEAMMIAAKLIPAG